MFLGHSLCPFSTLPSLYKARAFSTLPHNCCILHFLRYAHSLPGWFYTLLKHNLTSWHSFFCRQILCYSLLLNKVAKYTQSENRCRNRKEEMWSYSHHVDKGSLHRSWRVRVYGTWTTKHIGVQKQKMFRRLLHG